MKKSLSLILIMVLLIGGFVYLGNVIKEKHSDTDLRVTIIVPSEFGDKSFSDSAKEGGDLLIDYGVNVSYIECKGQNYKPMMMKAAGESDLVVCTGQEFWEITDVTQEYPYTNFIWFNDSVDKPSDYPNLLNVVFAENEGSYLVGYAAAAVSQSGVIGVILADDDAMSADLLAGFTQGAAQANDTVEIITVNAEGNYNDEALGDMLARQLIIDGADIIYTVNGKTGEGAIKLAKDRNVYIIGMGRDARTDYPEYSDIILCSMKEETGAAMFTLVKNYYDYGTFEGGTKVIGDTARRYMGVSYGPSDAVQLLDLQLTIQINTLKQKIVSREIKVNTAE